VRREEGGREEGRESRGESRGGKGSERRRRRGRGAMITQPDQMTIAHITKGWSL
jgi:hypothetical protein